MAIIAAPRIEPYGFEAKFEDQIVFLLASDEDFYRRVGFLIEPDALQNPIAQEVAKVIHHMVDARVTEKQRKPSPEGPNIFERRKVKTQITPLYVVQTLNQMSRAGGRIPRTVVTAAMDYLQTLEGEFDLEIDEEMVISLLVPELKQRIRNQAIGTAIGAYRDKKDFKRVQALLDEAETLGEPTLQIGAGNMRLDDPDTYAAIEALHQRVRIPLGLGELDREMGGLPEASLLCVMGDPGAGKSVLLNHASVESILGGMFTLYMTLEVEPEIVSARTLSNLTGIPINDLHGPGLARMKAIMADIAPHLGNFEVEMFEADVTRVQHLKDWVHRKEDEYGEKCGTAVVDYADYLSAGDLHTYTGMKHIYRSLYSWAHKDKTRVLTASATKGKKDKRSTTGLDDASDSRYKARIVDVMLAVDRMEEGLFISVPKNRIGKSSITVGPLQTDFECGRIIYTNRGNLYEYMEKAQQRLNKLYQALVPSEPVTNEAKVQAIVATLPPPANGAIHTLDGW